MVLAAGLVGFRVFLLLVVYRLRFYVSALFDLRLCGLVSVICVTWWAVAY